MKKDPIVEEVRKIRENLALNGSDGPEAQRTIFMEWTGRKIYAENTENKQKAEKRVAEKDADYGINK